ncbi:hypothetical protein Yalta_074 [Yalta virus]|nr:hypothetical protein Yalta_074 [Yalta virus]
MEPKKKSKNATIDFDYVRAINEYMDDSFLNKTLQSLKGGSKPNQREIVTYKINNTNYLANLYPDPVARGGKNTMLLDSIFKVPESFSLDNAMANLDIGGARPKSKKPQNKGKKLPCDNNKSGKRGPPKKKGGSELYEVDYREVEDFGGNNDNNDITNKINNDNVSNNNNNNELGGANKKKPGRKPKKNTC